MNEIKLALEQYAQKHPEIKDHILGIQYAILDAVAKQYMDGLEKGFEIAFKFGGEQK